MLDEERGAFFLVAGRAVPAALSGLPRATATVLELGPMASPRCADIVPMHRMRRIRSSRALVRREATKIDGFRDASPARPDATQQRQCASFWGFAQKGRDALPCDAEALGNLLHRQALGVERARLGPAYVRSTPIERR